MPGLRSNIILAQCDCYTLVYALMFLFMFFNIKYFFHASLSKGNSKKLGKCLSRTRQTTLGKMYRVTLIYLTRSTAIIENQPIRAQKNRFQQCKPRLYILPQHLARQTKRSGRIERYGLTGVVPVLTALLLSSLKWLIIFLCVFIHSFRVFVRKALQVNVPVAIFFPYGGLLKWGVTLRYQIITQSRSF